MSRRDLVESAALLVVWLLFLFGCRQLTLSSLPLVPQLVVGLAIGGVSYWLVCVQIQRRVTR